MNVFFMAFFSMQAQGYMYLDEPLALNIPLKVFFTYANFGVLLITIINKNMKPSIIRVQTLILVQVRDKGRGQPHLLIQAGQEPSALFN